MAIPAAIMDSFQQKKIDQLGEALVKLEDRVMHLEKENKILKGKIRKIIKAQDAKLKKDIHEHVKKLVTKIQTLEKEIESLKQ